MQLIGVTFCRFLGSPQVEGVPSVLLLASEANFDDKRRKKEDQEC